MLASPVTLVVLFVVLAVLSGRWRAILAQLATPLDLLIGLLGGVPLFVLALLVLPGPARIAGVAESIARGARRCRLRHSTRVLALGLRAGWEEAFWRGTAQVLCGNCLLAIALTSGLFTSRHLFLERVNRREYGLREGLELALFSVILGLVYAWTDRILLVIGMHWTRNLLIDLAGGRRGRAGGAPVVGSDRAG